MELYFILLAPPPPLLLLLIYSYNHTFIPCTTTAAMSQPPPPPLDIVHHPSLKNPHFWVMDVSTLRWVPQNELALSKGPTIVCSPSLLSTKRWRHTHSPKCCSFLAHDGETVKNTSLVCTNMLYWAGIIISTQLINNYIMECHSMA